MNYRSVKTRKSKDYLKALIVFAVIISVLTITPLVAASNLDEFEKAATAEKTKQESSAEDDQSEDDDSILEAVDEWVFFIVSLGTFFAVMDDGIEMSLARVDEDMETDTGEVEIRRTGEPTLPFFQYDHKYLKVNSDIDARENGLEVGYGPIGFSYRQTGFCEETPSDELTLTQYHLLLRISRKSSGEFGLGIGSLVMHGNDDHSGLSITFPIKLYPSDSLGVQFKPTYSWINGNSIDEYDLSLAYTIRYASIQLGYRFLEANGKELNGPYLGFSVYY